MKCPRKNNGGKQPGRNRWSRDAGKGMMATVSQYQGNETYDDVILTLQQHLGKLIKETQPMERLNINFKGPLPSSTKNKYFLCIVDEYSRFPFCDLCADMRTETVIKCLDNLFYTYGVCSFVHSDRWTSFKSDKLKTYFMQNGLASNMSTPYYPMGNGQVEGYDGTVWESQWQL